MPKTYPAKNDFTRGKFSPLLEDRSDERIYQNGARELENVFVLPHGGVTRRGGTRYSCQTRYSTGDVNLESFIFSENPKQSYVLEFGDKYLRFLWGYDKAPIIDPNSLDPSTKFTPSSTVTKDDVTFTGSYTGTTNLYLKVEILSVDGETGLETIKFTGISTFDTFEPDADEEETFTYKGLTITVSSFTGHYVGDYWETEVYWPLMLRTPWPESIVKDLQNGIIQREDVAFIAHGSYVPRKLSRYSHTDWRLEPWLPTKAPWQPSIGLKYNLYNVTNVWNQYKSHAISKGYLDYYFSESNGAIVLKSGGLDSSIGFSLDNTYYSTITNAFRVELLNAIGSIRASIEIYGSIYIPEDGSYQFALNSGNQGADLIIDSNVVASRYGKNVTPDDPAEGTFQATLAGRAGTVTLTAGEHTIRARCWLDISNRTLSVYWKKPADTTFALIPPKYFGEYTERYGVTCATYTAYDLAGTVTLPPVTQGAFDALFSTSTTGVTVNRSGHWDDRISFHSQAGMTNNPFTADLPPDCILDNTNHSMEISGYLTVDEDGSYQFAIDGNNGCEFVLYDSSNNVLASVIWLSNTTTQAQTDGFTEYKSSSWAKHASSAVTLTAGVYRFRARYWSRLKEFAFSVAWKTPGESTYVAIPQTAITPNAGYYPRCLTFHEQRIFAGGSLEEPQRIYSSKTFDFNDFTTGADADAGLDFRIASEQVDSIQWMNSKDSLYVGTLSTEYIVKGTNGALTPEDIQVKSNTSYGSAYIRPVKAEDAIYFVDRSEKGLREYSYVFERDKSVGVNVGILAEDLFYEGIQKLSYQQGGNAAFRFGHDAIDDYLRLHSKYIANPVNTPYSLNLLWALTTDGKLKSLTIEMLEKVYAWTEQTFGGEDVEVESITVLPGDGGDVLFLAVNRTIGVTTVRTLEWIDPTNLFDLGDFDYEIGGNSGLGSIVMTHLASETIRAVGLIVSAAGAITWEPICDLYNPLVPTYDLVLNSSGVIDFKTSYWELQSLYLYERYQIIYAGYPFYCTIDTLPFDVQVGKGMSSMGMMKRWIDIWLSVINTPQILLSSAVDTGNAESMEDAGTLTTGRQRFFILGWDREAALRVTHDYALPLTLRSIYGEMQVNTG